MPFEATAMAVLATRSPLDKFSSIADTAYTLIPAPDAPVAAESEITAYKEEMPQADGVTNQVGSRESNIGKRASNRGPVCRIHRICDNAERRCYSRHCRAVSVMHRIGRARLSDTTPRSKAVEMCPNIDRSRQLEIKTFTYNTGGSDISCTGVYTRPR